MEQMLKQAMPSKKAIFTGVGILALVITGLNSYTSVGGGESVRVQNNLTGNATWYTSEGYKLKAPFMSTVHRYPQEVTVAITDNDELCDTASICGAPRQVAFADTYGITMETSFRYSLPKDPVNLENMHDKVKSVENLLGTTLLPFSADLVNYTSNQFRAEDFMQGGQNEFKSRLIDQATNGMIQTEREKIIIQTERSTLDTERGEGTATGEQFRWEVVTKLDENGVPIRTPAAIEAYGITLVTSGINLVDYLPQPELRSFMMQKQERVRDRARIVEDQENERQKAITAQLTGERERIEKQNQLLREKDAAKVRGEQEVMQAELLAKREVVEREKEAQLAIIDKQRELQVAKDNEAIQAANAAAAKYEAQAIREKGFAEADVAKAALAAKESNKEIYLAELKLEEVKAMAEVLPKVKVDMPEIMMVGDTGAKGSSVESLLSTSLAKGLMNGSLNTTK